MKKVDWFKFVLNVIKYAITLLVGAIGGNAII